MKAVALALFAIVVLSTPVDIRAAQSPPLTIRLYNSAHVPDATLAIARSTAVGILDDAGTNVRIRDCGDCGEPLATAEVVVRLIPAPAFNATLRPEAFGLTYVVKESDRGWLATVFVDRIEAAAARAGADAGQLLGRVMAHEVGHLLLGVGYHGPIGVMQAEWSDAMLSHPDREWRFSALEADRMIRRMAHP